MDFDKLATLIIALITAIALLITSIGGFILQMRNSKEIKEVKNATNSVVKCPLIEIAKREGVIEGIAEQKQREE